MIDIEKYDSRTGYKKTIETDGNYDYCQQIARAAYADMLHDSERNEKYNAALEIAIKEMHKMNKKAIVLDIGTGTGLLSLFAERNGADEIYACECFTPMANCAKEVIALNNPNSKIKVIPKRSNELTVGDNGDLPHKANILVTEVFDTELIGEGAISTFNHAHIHLLEKDAIVIPDSANVFALVFDSELVNKWHALRDISIDGRKPCTIKIPECITNCVGTTVVHDVQLSQLPLTSFKQITSPKIIFRFDFTKGSIVAKEQICERLKCLSDGVTHGVFMWWEISMSRQIPLIDSCAPTWIRNDSNAPWRDHWMQAIYYFPRVENVKKNEEVNLIVGHDEYSWQFRITKLEGKIEEIVYNDFCRCSIHYCSRSRIGMFNDQNRWSKYEKALSPVVDSDTICVCLSENTLLGVYAALLGAKKVYQLNMAQCFDYGFKKIIEENNLESKIYWEHNVHEIVEILEHATKQKIVVIADPYFEASSLPMDNIMAAFYTAKFVKPQPSNKTFLPCNARLCILPVHFDHLWKIRAPVENVLGIKLKPFDELIQNAIKYCDEQLDSQPLWEYPCIALSKPVVFTVALTKLFFLQEDTNWIGSFNFETDGICNGIVVWMDWIFDDSSDIVISSGPTEPVTTGEYVKWDIYSKQGVYFIHPACSITRHNCLKYEINFFPNPGTFDYNFDIV